MEKKFNPRMLVLARESRGLTQTELSKLISLPQGNLSRIEQGLLGVQDKVLDDIVKTLEYPEDFFYQPEEIYTGLSFHRKRQSIPQKTLSKIDAIVNIRRLHIKKLNQSVDLQVNQIPFHDIEYEQVSPQFIAQSARQHWCVPKGPIKNMTKLLEDAGIFVVLMDFETMQIDGFSTYFNDSRPIVYINKSISGDRMRFTLAHELGHIIMHKYPTETVEEEADQFAAEFLMPQAEIEADLTGLTIRRLVELKRYWKVSMAALLVQARRLQIITSNQYRSLWVVMSRYGYKTKEPAEIPVEQPTLLKELIDLFIDNFSYNLNDMEKVLCLEKNEVKELYLKHRIEFQDSNIPKPHLTFIRGGINNNSSSF